MKSMFKCCYLLFVLMGFVVQVLKCQPRGGLISNSGSSGVSISSVSGSSSPYTLGTFIGVGHAFRKFSHYNVNDEGVVYLEREGDAIVYGVFALPSVNLFQVGNDKIPISLIVPMGVMKASNEDPAGAIGFGFSLGFNASAGADIGFAVVALSTFAESLSEPQKESFEKQQPLPDFVDHNIIKLTLRR